MGGTAYLIKGHLAPERLRPVPLPRNFLDTLLRRQRYAKPVTHAVGRGTLTDVPCKELDVISRRFVDDLTARLHQPSDADELVLSYLKMGVTSTYVRVQRAAPDTPDQEYVQVTFSGCAGMAEVCAMVAWHWFDLWYRENAQRLKAEVLLPFGFEPVNNEETAEATLFLPVGGVGYASFVPFSGVPGTGEYELDGSIGEDGDAETISQVLNRDYASLFADGQCRCTLCSPDFPAVHLRL